MRSPFISFICYELIMCLCVFVFDWYIAYLIPIFTVFSCIRRFIFRFGMLLKSFFAAQCSMNRIGFGFFLSLKNIFQQQLPLPLPCYDFTSIKLTYFDPFINIHFFVNQRNSLLVYFWVLQKIPSLKV